MREPFCRKIVDVFVIMTFHPALETHLFAESILFRFRCTDLLLKR
jgi:hypothetical protein